MTQQARAVLSVCRLALEELSADPPFEQWQLRWFTAVALLRCVGDVLDKTDRKSGNAMQAAIDDAYARLKATKPQPSIYWQFIRDERDRAVHEFTFAAGRGVVVDLDQGRVRHTHEMVRGFFKGQDQRDVVRQAIEWWEEHLDQIDREAAATDR